MADLLPYALTTLQDVKESLGIASSDLTWDNLIKRKINQATEIIEGYCGRRFKATNYTDEEYDGTWTDQLVLRNFPVISFTGLSARDSSLNQGDFDTINSEHYFVDNNSGIIDSVAGSFYGSYNRWRVTYRAGYETIPSDLQEACAILASYLTINDPGSNTGIASKKEGQREVTYHNLNSSAQIDMFELLGIQPTLDRYAGVSLSGIR